MPELAEVEVVRRNLEVWWKGRRADRVRIEDDAVLKEGRPEALREALEDRLKAAHRRGKHLICEMETKGWVLFHFRMTGKIVRRERLEDGDYRRLGWRVGPSSWLVFKDQRRLGGVRWFEEDPRRTYPSLAKMGPEPEALSVEDIRQAGTGRRMMKSTLLDQEVVAGVGNIAISEVFWQWGWSPRVRIGDLDDGELSRLVEVLPDYFDGVLEASMGDEVHYQNSGGAENIFAIYGREGEPCECCGKAVERAKVGGRSSYYCPGCQG